MIIRSFFLLFAAILWLPSLCLGGTFGIEEKIALENSLSQKIEEVVVKMLGDKNIIVIVTIDHNTTIEQEVKKMETQLQETRSAKKSNYLPGIPMDALESELVSRPDKALFQTLKLPPFIRNISVTLIVSDKIPNEKIEKVRDYVVELLHLDFGRGDRIGVQKMSFATDPKDKTSLLERTIFSQMPWFIALLLLMFFIFGPVRSFMKNIISTIEVFRVQADTRISTRGESGRVEGAGAKQQSRRSEAGGQVYGSAPASAQDEEKRHFDFINENNIKSLLYLLKDEKPDTIAVVMIYLPKEYSSMIIDALDEDLRVETLKRMATVKQYRSDEVLKIEERLKEEVDYLLGGPQSIAELINGYDPETREKILSDIERNDPSAAAEIRKILITFEDLVKLKKEHLYEVYKVVGTRVLAAALKGSSETIIKAIFDGLTSGARDMLKQEMDLIPSNIPESRINQAKKSAIIIMQKLENQGLIRIPR